MRRATSRLFDLLLDMIGDDTSSGGRSESFVLLLSYYQGMIFLSYTSSKATNLDPERIGSIFPQKLVSTSCYVLSVGDYANCSCFGSRICYDCGRERMQGKT